MIAQALKLEEEQVRKLLGAASPDAALLYLYISSGNAPEGAGEALHLSPARISCAGATLRQMGMWPEERRSRIAPGERPNYSEQDVLTAMEQERSFRGLYEEVQRQLGRNLNTEELKILLGFVRYLGLPEDVISMLVSHCRERARRKGSSRNPSLRTIEKEAYHWAEQGIDTLEEAAAYIQYQNVRHSRMSQLMNLLQIRGRALTAAEEKYAQSWLDLGFEDSAIALAYERTCLNTGGLNWAYMNKILQRWHGQGLHTLEAVQNGDRKMDSRNGPRQLDADEQAAIRRMMQEG